MSNNPTNSTSTDPEGTAPPSPTSTDTESRSASQPSSPQNYTPELTVHNRADTSLSVTLRSVRSQPDDGDGTASIGERIFERRISPDDPPLDLRDQRPKSPVRIDIENGDDVIYQEIVEEHAGVEIIVDSPSDIDDRWVYV